MPYLSYSRDALKLTMSLSSTKRLVSLDAFRGLAMVIVALSYFGGHLPEFVPGLTHADWHGLTFLDLWFPFFIFVAGAAVSLSIPRRLEVGHSRKRVMVRVVKRATLLFALGLLLSTLPLSSFDLGSFRIMGVLQRIALVILFTSAIFLASGPRRTIPWAIVLLLVWWALMQVGGGSYDKTSNFASYVDRTILDGHIYTYTKDWGDPEGIVGTLTATSTALFGAAAGWTLRKEGDRAVPKLVITGLAGLALGLLLNPIVPINKNLWTATFTILTAGLSAFLLGFIHVACLKGVDRLFDPLAVLGRNSLFSYVIIVVLSAAYWDIQILGPNGPIPIYLFIVDILLGPLSPFWGSLVFATFHILLVYLVARILKSRESLLKVLSGRILMRKDR
ncbi:MAG: heparan-alpha-glucosaminide N-acetyltransferase domain-containing protein [Nitrososphaerales archaeon]